MAEGRKLVGTSLPGAGGEEGWSETILGSAVDSKATVILSDDFLDADDDEDHAPPTQQLQVQTQNEGSPEIENEILTSQAGLLTNSSIKSAVSQPARNAKIEPSENVVFLLGAHDLKDDSVLGMPPPDSISDLTEIVESERLIYTHFKAASRKPSGDQHQSQNIAPAAAPVQSHAKAHAQPVNLRARPTVEELEHLLVSAQARALQIQKQIDLVKQQRLAQKQTTNVPPNNSTHATAAEDTEILEGVDQNVLGSVHSQHTRQSNIQSHLDFADVSALTTTAGQITEELQNVLETAQPTWSNTSTHTTTAGQITEELQNVLETVQPTWSNTSTHTTVTIGEQMKEASEQNVLVIQGQNTVSNIQSRPVTVPPGRSHSQFVQFQNSEMQLTLPEQRNETGVARPSMVHSIHDEGHEDDLKRSTSVLSIRTICGTDGGRSTKESENVMSFRHEHLSNIKHQYICTKNQHESDDALNRRVSELIQPILAEQKNEVQREASIEQSGAESSVDEAFVEESLSRVASNLAVQSIYCIDVQSLATEEEAEVEVLQKPLSVAQSQSQQHSQIESRRASIEQQLSQYRLSDRDRDGGESHGVSELIRPVLSEQRDEVQRELDVAFSYGDEESVTERDFDEDDLTRVASDMANRAICAKDEDCKE